MSTDRQIPRAYLSVLAALMEGGGSGELDLQSRVLVGPTKAPLAGADHVSLLRLVAEGMLAGERGLMILTEAGRTKAQEVLAGRLRVGS